MTGKILLFLLVFTGLISAGATEKILIVTSSGKTIHPTSVTLRNDGALEYRLSGELKKSVIGNDAYLYARLPQPEEVKNADKKFKSRQWEDAAALYRKAGNDHRKTGWRVYCVYNEALALDNMGRKNEAILALSQLEKESQSDPGQISGLNQARDFLAKLLIDVNAFDEALELLQKQLRLNDSSLVFAAHIRRADILQKLDRKPEAAMLYYRTVLLFPNDPRSAEALYTCYTLLSALQDPDKEKIAEMLKQNYKESSFTAQLPR